MTVGINPLTVSPGAPLSLDAAGQPWESAVIALGSGLLAASSYLCVRAIRIGEAFSNEGITDDPEAMVRRVLAAYCRSLDAQSRPIDIAARIPVAGGTVTAAGCLWILLQKIF